MFNSNQFKSINEFNNYLSESLIKIDLINYFKDVHSKFYKDIDISFMDYFLNLVENKNKFIISHDKLKEYGIITSDRNNDIKEKLKYSNLIIYKDYLIITSDNLQDILNEYNYIDKNILETYCGTFRSKSQEENLNHGAHLKKLYLLTPKAFKICLMNAKNTNKFRKYYLLLEEVFKYYKDYETDYHLKLINMKDDKIDKLEKKIDKLMIYAKDTNEIVRSMKFSLDKVIKNIYKNNFSLNCDPTHIKVLVVYLYRDKNSNLFSLNFRYHGLNFVTRSINNLDERINEFNEKNCSNYKRYKCFPLDIISDNTATIQFIRDRYGKNIKENGTIYPEFLKDLKSVKNEYRKIDKKSNCIMDLTKSELLDILNDVSLILKKYKDNKIKEYISQSNIKKFNFYDLASKQNNLLKTVKKELKTEINNKFKNDKPIDDLALGNKIKDIFL